MGYLDRQNVQCPDGQALQYFRMIGGCPHSGDRRYEFRCGTFRLPVLKKRYTYKCGTFPLPVLKKQYTYKCGTFPFPIFEKRYAFKCGAVANSSMGNQSVMSLQ